MSFHQKNITAFIEVLNNKRSLFSPEDKANLTQLFSSLPDEEEKLSTAISTWTHKNSKILEAQLKTLKNYLSHGYRSNRTTESITDKLKSSDYQANKQGLLSAIQHSLSSSVSELSNSH